MFKKNVSVDSYPARFPCKKKSKQVVKMIEEAIDEGESLSSQVEVWAEGLQPGLGQPVFKKIKSELAAAYMSLGASLSFELGDVQASQQVKGSVFHKNPKNYGGLRGGMTTGERLVLRLNLKPPSSLKEVAQKGRHDPVIATRAVPVLEAMTYLVVVDHLLWSRLDTLS